MTTQKELILITGSGGLIGSALIHKLGLLNTVIGFDRAGLPYPPEEAGPI